MVLIVMLIAGFAGYYFVSTQANNTASQDSTATTEGLSGACTQATTTNSTSVPQDIVIAGSGTVTYISSGQIACASFQLPVAANITGSFLATDPLSVYILTPSQESSFTASATPAHDEFSIMGTVSGSISVTLGPGTYYLIFDNPRLSANSVEVTQTISATT
jgi:hypothetical protein